MSQVAISPLQRARQNLAANVVLQGRGGTRRHSAGATSGQLGPRQPRPLRARRSTSSAAGRPLTSHTSAFSRFSAGRRALSRFSKQQGPGSLRSFLGGRRHPMGWRRLLPARRGDGPHVPAQSVSKQGQGFQVAHCAERCEQRGLQARAHAHIRQTETLLLAKTRPQCQTYPGGK